MARSRKTDGAEDFGIPWPETTDAPRRDRPWEQHFSSHDPTLAFNLREFVVDVFKQETMDKFVQLENKGLKLRNEIAGHLREAKAEIKLLKSNEPGTTQCSAAGLPVGVGISKMT